MTTRLVICLYFFTGIDSNLKILNNAANTLHCVICTAYKYTIISVFCYVNDTTKLHFNFYLANTKGGVRYCPHYLLSEQSIAYPTPQSSPSAGMPPHAGVHLLLTFLLFLLFTVVKKLFTVHILIHRTIMPITILISDLVLTAHLCHVLERAVDSQPLLEKAALFKGPPGVERRSK